jgi:ATP-dependent Clp protease ATP-binding subunit ClpC
MFERFNDKARRVIVGSHEEARRLDHHYIGTEHLLLGLIGETTGTAGRALQVLGVELDVARAQVEQIIGRGDPAHGASGHMPFTPRTKKILELAASDAAQLGLDHIGTEHLLLALVREGDGVGAQILARSGIDAERAGQEIARLTPSILEAAWPAAWSRTEKAARRPDLQWSDDVMRRLASFAARLSAIEQRLSETGGEAGG